MHRFMVALVSLATLATMVACDPQPVASVKVQFVPWVTGLSSPTALTHRNGIPYVAERGGTIKALTVFGSPTVLTIPGVPTAGERGLLGLAFSPDGSKLYVDHNDGTGDIHVAEYTMGAGLDVDAGSRRELLTIGHRQFTNHNGGGLAVDSRGLLYISVGDGGGAGDPNGNAQRLDSLLGKILRIDPRPSASGPYSIPADNPFVKTANARPEIYAYGLRNPWRFSFDRATGDLTIGDVGQDSVEEIDFARKGTARGANYGWRPWEGRSRNFDEPAPGARFPVITKTHADGWCSITGGYIVRDRAVAGLYGRYVYGDFCKGELRSARLSAGKATGDSMIPGVKTISGLD